MNELIAKGVSLGAPSWVWISVGVASVIGFIVLAVVYGGRDENGVE